MEDRMKNEQRSKKAYEKEMDSKLKRYEAEIEELKARAEKAKAMAKVRVYEQIEDLFKKRDQVKQRLQRLKESGDEAWKDLKTGVESAYKDLRTALDSAVSKFKPKS